MGKSKKRTLNKTSEKNTPVLKRNEIIKQIISDASKGSISGSTAKYISLFGISAEELSEAGAEYEELSLVKHLLS